jgi:hypothetical protein
MPAEVLDENGFLLLSCSAAKTHAWRASFASRSTRSRRAEWPTGAEVDTRFLSGNEGCKEETERCPHSH